MNNGHYKYVHNCKWLLNSRIFFGMITPEMFPELNDGDQMMVSRKQITL